MSFVENLVDFVFDNLFRAKRRIQKKLLPAAKLLRRKIIRLSGGQSVRLEHRKSAGQLKTFMRCHSPGERIHVPLEDDEYLRLLNFSKEFSINPGNLADLEAYNRAHRFQIIRGVRPILMWTKERCFYFQFAGEGCREYALTPHDCREVAAFLESRAALVDERLPTQN